MLEQLTVHGTCPHQPCDRRPTSALLSQSLTYSVPHSKLAITVVPHSWRAASSAVVSGTAIRCASLKENTSHALVMSSSPSSACKGLWTGILTTAADAGRWLAEATDMTERRVPAVPRCRPGRVGDCPLLSPANPSVAPRHRAAQGGPHHGGCPPAWVVVLMHSRYFDRSC